METRVFDANMRCDRCGSQAYHAVTSPKSGKELLFCGHHFTLHHNTLSFEGWDVLTDTSGWEKLTTPIKVNL